MARINIRITDRELEVLEMISTMGPSNSEKVHQNMNPQPDYLLVMRTLHALVEKGLLRRIMIGHKPYYRTSRQYAFLKGLLKDSPTQG